MFRKQPAGVGPQCQQCRDHQLVLLGVVQNELIRRRGDLVGSVCGDEHPLLQSQEFLGGDQAAPPTFSGFTPAFFAASWISAILASA